MKHTATIFKKYQTSFKKYQISTFVMLSIVLGSSFITKMAFAVSMDAPYEQVERADHDDVVKAYLNSGNCTATILGGQWIISAAHCIEPDRINTAYQGDISIISSVIPYEYEVAMQSGTYKKAPTLDFSIWQADTYLQHKNFKPISNRIVQDNEIIKMVAFGRTGEQLNSIEQAAIENWHWGAYLPMLVAQSDIDVCHFEGGISDDGWCEYVPVNYMYTYDIGRGYAEKGDSGATLINENGYIMGVLRGRPTRKLSSATFQYHTNTRLTKEEQLNFLHEDLNENSTNLMYANRLSYEPSKSFILDTINGWHYPTWIEKLGAGERAILKVQSLHRNDVNLFNNIRSEGDISLDVFAITCHQAEDELSDGHTPDKVAPYDVCLIPVTSNNGGEGIIYLSNDEMIGVNGWDDLGVKLISNDDSQTSQESSTSGGSLGGFGLVSLLFLALSRKKRMREAKLATVLTSLNLI